MNRVPSEVVKAQADIESLYDIDLDNEPALSEAFEKIFSLNATEFRAGIEDDGNTEGVFFRRENGQQVYLMIMPCEQQMSELELSGEANFVVYEDSEENEGPYGGECDPVNTPKTFDLWQDAKAEFIKQIQEA